MTHLANFDGLVGPTHNYAGLSLGNIASEQSRYNISNPKAAALQGLKKMKFLADLGVPQGVLPPQLRPDLKQLRRIGYDSLKEADPTLLAACSSASSMWCANAASVSASSDALDNKVHIVPANLLTFFHRSIECATTAQILKQVFPQNALFAHEEPLPHTKIFSDEGAANQIRLFCGEKGLTLYVYGATGSLYPARQTKEAAEALARTLRLKEGRFYFAEQSQTAIDHGVFHNDVIAMGTGNLLIVHEKAYKDQERVLDGLRSSYFINCEEELTIIEVAEEELSLEEAVDTYLFNSQLIRSESGTYSLIAPLECQEHPKAKALIERLPLQDVYYFDLRQSMRNGGGPACLRLQVPLRDRELRGVHPGVWLDDTLYEKLTLLVERRYRDHLSLDDLRDTDLLKESIAIHQEIFSTLSLLT